MEVAAQLKRTYLVYLCLVTVLAEPLCCALKMKKKYKTLKC